MTQIWCDFTKNCVFFRILVHFVVMSHTCFTFSVKGLRVMTRGIVLFTRCVCMCVCSGLYLCMCSRYYVICKYAPDACAYPGSSLLNSPAVAVPLFSGNTHKYEGPAFWKGDNLFITTVPSGYYMKLVKSKIL